MIKDEIRNNAKSVVKFFSYTTYRDEFSWIRPDDNNFDYVSIGEVYDGKVIKVYFKEGTKDAQVQEWVKAQDAKLGVKEMSRDEFVAFYKTSETAQRDKGSLRMSIRAEKDIEDDLTDQKIVIQNLLYLLCDIWRNIFTAEQKKKSKYNEIMEGLAKVVIDQDVQMRADLAGPEVFSKIIADETKFASLAKSYLEKKSGKIV